ncbi:MAG: extracellular solute-binding protein [Synergistaceae bacterium]|nr:extracellular solute-binding protein [Synergistaceae bacterium]
MRKFVLSMLVVLLLVSSACAEVTSLTLALRAGTYSEVIKRCLPAFEAEHGVKAEVLELAEDDLHSKLALDAANSEGAYDLCMVDGSWMAEFSSNGVLADLGALGVELDDDIIPAATKISYYGGKLYLVPYYGNVTVLLYNKALVNGKPLNSLDDLLSVCRAAKESGKKGFIYRGDTENNLVVDFMPVLLSFGAWVLDGNNKPSVNTPEFREAVKFYLELIATGDAEAKDDLIATIDSGAGTMGVGWPGWYLPSESSNADYCAITGRVSNDGTAHNANVYGVWTIGIPANSTHKALAAELLKYLINPAVQKSTVEFGGVPCRYSSLTDPEVLAKFPQYKVVCAALEGGVYRPVIEEWTEFYTILGTELGNIFNGVKTVDKGLEDAQTALEQLMN